MNATLALIIVLVVLSVIVCSLLVFLCVNNKAKTCPTPTPTPPDQQKDTQKDTQKTIEIEDISSIIKKDILGDDPLQVRYGVDEGIYSSKAEYASHVQCLMERIFVKSTFKSFNTNSKTVDVDQFEMPHFIFQSFVEHSSDSILDF